MVMNQNGRRAGEIGQAWKATIWKRYENAYVVGSSYDTKH